MPAIDNSSLAECHKVAILTGLHESVNIENFSSKVIALINNEYHSKISHLEFKSKGIASWFAKIGLRGKLYRTPIKKPKSKVKK